MSWKTKIIKSSLLIYGVLGVHWALTLSNSILALTSGMALGMFAIWED